jgi:transcriptional regulator with XRE-family HTH domain
VSNPITLDWTPLRVMRRKLDMSQARTGALIGVSGGMICHVEHNRRGLSAAQLVGLAVGLGTPMYDLFISTVKKP